MNASSLRVHLTHVPETAAWIRTDLLVRLLPFAALIAAVQVLWRPSWLGISSGRPGLQLAFGAAGAVVMFAAAAALQLALSRRRGAIAWPADARDLALQAAYYVVNAPLEEGIFRGLVQGGLGSVAGGATGAVVGTALYVLYHRLGRWDWVSVASTALVGVPLALAFWLLPGPPSLLGVSIAHAGATCGFIGVGPALLHRLGLV